MNSRFRFLLQGSLGFAVVSVLAFAVWAFGASWFAGFGGELGLYTCIAAVFLCLSGLALSGLAGSYQRFYGSFLPAFVLYSVLWCVAWFTLHGRVGEWVGAWGGCLGFAWLALRQLSVTKGFLWVGVILGLLHCLGYFVGDWVMYDCFIPLAKGVRETDPEKAKRYVLAGKLGWGLCYGLGFGAGLGWLFHHAFVQTSVSSK